MANFTKKDAQEIRAILEAAGFEGEKLNKLIEKLSSEGSSAVQSFESLKEEMSKIAESSAVALDLWKKSEAPIARIQVAEEAKLKTMLEMEGTVNRVVAETQVWAAQQEALQKLDEANLIRLKKIADLNQQKIQDLETIKAKQGELDEEQKKDLANAQDGLVAGVELINILTQEMMLRDEVLKKQQRQADAAKDLADTIENLSPLSATGFADSMLGTLADIGSMEKALSTVGAQLKMQINPANLLGTSFSFIAESTGKMVLATDAAQAGFFKATGATREYDEVIRTVREDSAVMGVNIEDAAEAVTELYTGMTQFSRMTGEAQAELANFTSQMDQMGVSTGTTVALLDSATMALHMTSDEAIAMSKEVTAAAQALGLPVEQMASDLQAALPQLAAYGTEAVKVFKNVAAAAKMTGIATGRLLDITSQFDTFEGAAEAVGRLNGVLGGNYLNSLEMVNMTEDERISTLLRSMEASGKAFTEMSKYEQKAVAASVGITDMAEANKLLGQSADAYDLMKMKADAGMLSQDQMQEAADRSRDVMAKLENIMQSMAVAVGPLVDLVNFLAEGFLKLNDILGGSLAPILLTLSGIYTTMLMQQKMMLALEAARATKAVVMNGIMLIRNGLYIKQNSLRAASIVMQQAEISRETRLLVLKNQSLGAGIKGIAIGLKGIVVTKAAALWAGISTAAVLLSTKAKAAWNAVSLTGLLTGARELVVRMASAAWLAVSTVATWAVVAAKWAWVAVTTVLSGAVAAFGVVFNVALGGIPLLIGGIIVGITLLIYYFDEVTQAVKDFINFTSSGINNMIEGINSIPMLGLEIPLIPMLAEGATNFTGTAIVGEAGPEIVTTRNTNVVSNENIARLMKSTESIVNTTTGTGTGGDQATTNMLLQQLVTALTTPTGSPAAAGGASAQDILLVMDPAGTKVIAKAVGAQLNKTHNVFAKRS
jgi:hypothetical protein